MTPASIRERMTSLHKRMHGPAPDKYAAVAEWWYWHAKESASYSEALRYAASQRRLYNDMIDRPLHYRAKPNDVTDYQWSRQ